MKLKNKTQKLFLSKQSISNLSDSDSKKINGGDWTITATLVSILQNTCTCTFYPKCASDNLL